VILIKWLPIVAWITVISYLSFSSLESLPVPQFFSADKIGHFFMYFVLELLFLLPLNKNLRAFYLATIAAAIFSGLTELIQHYWVINRQGEVADFLANLTGLAVAFLLLKRRIKT
jgi:VanZ family protein